MSNNKTRNRSNSNVDDHDYSTEMESTDSMGGVIAVFKDRGGMWGEHHKNSGEDIITEYFPGGADEAKAWFDAECEKSVWS